MTLRERILRALLVAPGTAIDVAAIADIGPLMAGAVPADLRALEREGLVRAQRRPGPASRGGRPRFVYSITEAGRRALAESEAGGMVPT